MNRQQEQLFKRIQAFEVDEPGASLKFADRLAKETRWPADHARRVAEEYKKFLFLAVAAGHPVTPSEAVDQAWHLHLTYTRSYWDRLCSQTLGQPLHHEPSRGGPEEERKFQQWYASTVASYERMFGVAPPRDIWPPPKTPDVRFAIREAEIRASPPREARRNGLRVAGIAAALAGGALAALACTQALMGHNISHLAAWIVAGVCAVAIVGGIAMASCAPRTVGHRPQHAQDGGASQSAMYAGAVGASESTHRQHGSEISAEADVSGADGGCADGGGASCSGASCGSGCGGGGCGGGCGGG